MIVMLTMARLAVAQAIRGSMPSESAPHEGTWLQWPHHYTYGVAYRNRLDATWVAMTRTLVLSENVHIIAYNASEQARITKLLTTANVPLATVDFLLQPTDDCWVRDNGPLFVYDSSRALKITDWGFNGWGLDAPYAKDNLVPSRVSSKLGMPRIDLSTTILEGGAIEIDGQGVMLATRSSILEPARNPGLTQAQLQSVLTANLGVTKFIWLNGTPGGKVDITDTHIDGFARFGSTKTIVTMSNSDLAYWGLSTTDISVLDHATDINNTPYTFVRLPLTAKDVTTTYGKNLGYKGSYVNFYVGNTVVLIPSYNDANDQVAAKLLQSIYPERKVVSIDVRNLYAQGGMIHCVTQQQPVRTK